MTTIAYKDGVLVADRMINRRGTPTVSYMNKVAVMDNIAYGAAGSAGVIDYVRDFIDSVPPGEEFLTACRNLQAMLKKDFPDNFTVMLLHKNSFRGMIVELSDDGLVRYETSSTGFTDGCGFAIGSGADYAMGAMAAGKSAAQAVEIANRLDAGSGLGVTVIDLEGEWK